MTFKVVKPVFADHASQFVNTMGQFTETILIKKDHWVVDAKSLLGLLAVGLKPGDQVEFEISPDSSEVKEAILQTGLFEEA
ncbi:phosphocarrier protein [Melghiribacillus thermohalophilus]|uniref:Phosphocarrier protein n=1 Tax=Melghiribacillus thermohalophilus TaxID=1324956 RepID=A0A4V2V2M0_9BACI|nr:HPr family phosphocarrier protein [Melghiribacillus thermohalophilus]TCT25655.1 phosphocarrier protein [Melghiribacillus thermohalophilus]